MRLFSLFMLIVIQACLYGQTTLRGTVCDVKGTPLPGASVSLVNTYQGASTNTSGAFSFRAVLRDSIVLNVTSMGYESVQQSFYPPFPDTLSVYFALKASFQKLRAVTITAGQIEASDRTKSIMLNALDIVTTSGALGDIAGALSTLPGTSTIGNDGRLFVRGGAARETAIFFDGGLLSNAFGSRISGVPTRGRFSPQLFSGTFFSTGAYSAEFGQALSGVLNLQTPNEVLQTQTDIAAMTVGGTVSHTQKWKQQSLQAEVGFLNLSPYQSVVPQNLEWKTAPKGLNTHLHYKRVLGKNTVIKAFYAFQNQSMGIFNPVPTAHALELYPIDLSNEFHYANFTFGHAFSSRSKLNTVCSWSSNAEIITLDSGLFSTNNNQLHVKSKWTYSPVDQVKLITGVEQFFTAYNEGINGYKSSLESNRTSSFAELNYHPITRFGVRVGLRNSIAANTMRWMPRLSAAFDMGNGHQLAMGMGRFYQAPSPAIQARFQQFNESSSTHYLLSYQRERGSRFVRIEAFAKNYTGLPISSSQFLTMEGSGSAYGADFFYRDRQLVPNLDFWITYSWVHGRRAIDFSLEQVQPNFAPTHNASLVAKYWVKSIRSQLGASFQANSGYPYTNPNKKGLQNSTTATFNNLSLSWSWLYRQHIIIHAAVTNVLGTDNVFGYDYALKPSNDGTCSSVAQTQPADRFVFVGLFYTITKNKQSNQLNNL